jgi:hypothetical protein
MAGRVGMTSVSGTTITAGPGGGNALLHAADGSGLRCQFNYNGLGSTGTGICTDDQGQQFDLQIS